MPQATRRIYADVSDFRAPFDSPNLTLTGLGAVRQHGYMEISNYRAPYDNGYFQNNQLFGLGAAPEDNKAGFPDKLRVFVETGEEMGTIRRDAAAASAQVPRWAWFGVAAVSGLMTYFSYKKYKEKYPDKKSSSTSATHTPNGRRRLRRNGSNTKRIEGVTYYKYKVTFTTKDGRRLSRTFWSPGDPWVRGEAGRMLADEFGDYGVKDGSASLQRV